MESLSNARECKSEKELYQQAISDLEVKSIASNLYNIEIGSLTRTLASYITDGLVERSTTDNLQKMARKIMDEAANKVIGASQVIFKA